MSRMHETSGPRHLASKSRAGGPGIEDDHGQCRDPAMGVRRSASGNQKPIAFHWIVPFDRQTVFGEPAAPFPGGLVGHVKRVFDLHAD